MKQLLARAEFRKFAFPAGVLVGALLAAIGACYGFAQWTEYHAQNAQVRAVIRTYDAEAQMAAASLYSLKAQQEMAEWSYALYWVGFVGVVASVGGIGLVLLNFLALSEQNRMARHFGQAQTQPYLTVGTPALFRQTGNINNDFNNRQCELEIELINSGSTPAIDVQVFFAFYFTTEFHDFTRTDDPVAEFQRLDLAPLAASRSTRLTTQFSVTNDAMRIGPEMRDANCEFAVAVLVLYRDVASDKEHELCVEISTTERRFLNRGLGNLELDSAVSKRWFINDEEHLQLIWGYSNPDRGN